MPRISNLVSCLLIGGMMAGNALAQLKVDPQPLQDAALPATAASGTGLTATGCSISACLGNPCRSGSTACRQMTCPETSWRVCVQDAGLKGLWVGPVDLKRSPTAPWMRVLYDAGPAEIFVPYHEGSTRLHDLRFCTPPFVCLREVFPADAGATGQLVTLSADVKPKVVAELRDRGPAWLCKAVDGSGNEISHLRRGEEMVLWGVYDTGNYDYIFQYEFRDDGSIGLRLGATGYNHPGQPFEPHMHDTLWYMDMDLVGPSYDSAYVIEHQEGNPFPLEATDVDNAFNGGFEGALEWNPEAFHSILLEDLSTNVHGRSRGYELVPFRTGTGRHNGGGELFTQNDFWVTVWNGYENNWRAVWSVPDQYLLGSANGVSGTANQQPILNRDLVLWHLSSAHHEPHDEDQATGNSGMEGITLMHWMGADLVPHNLFDQNPLGGPHRSLCEP